MESYKEFKPSNVHWIGYIPKHWEIKQLRSFLSLFTDKGHGDAQLLSVTREQGVIVRNKDDKEENHNFVPEDLSGYKYIEKGDFAINKMKAWQGSYAVSDYNGIVSPAYFTCKLRGVNKDFFSRAIRSRAYIPFFTQYSKGIRVDQWDLNPNALKIIPFFLPPIPEQEKIVSYLDSKTSNIDAYVAEKEKELQLLNELKESEISNVVTRGLNPDVMMKDSGISWIGMIPEHWDTRRVKYLYELITSKSHSQIKIGLENIESFSGRYIPSDNEFDGDGIDTKVNDIVYGKLRPYLCKVWLAEWECNAVGDFYVFRCKSVLTPEYSKLIFLSSQFTDICTASTYGAKMPRVSSSFIQSQHFPVPPIEEQRAIVSYIEAKCAKINSLISDIEAEIEYLKEYKQRLIADCVTGQICVMNK